MSMRPDLYREAGAKTEEAAKLLEAAWQILDESDRNPAENTARRSVYNSLNALSDALLVFRT